MRGRHAEGTRAVPSRAPRSPGDGRTTPKQAPQDAEGQEDKLQDGTRDQDRRNGEDRQKCVEHGSRTSPGDIR